MLSSGQHHAFIAGVPCLHRVPGVPAAYWFGACECGMETSAVEWRTVFGICFDHVKENNSVSVFDEPVDLAPLVKTRLAWDLLDHNDMGAWLTRLGLTPAPEDMSALEHEEAHVRIDKMAPLSGLAETYALIIAEINTAYLSQHRKESTGEGFDEEQTEDLTTTCFQMIRSGIFALLAEWLHDGLLDYGPAVKQHLGVH